MRVGYLFISLPSAYELLFQSPTIFVESGVQTASITNQNTQILLNDAAYVIYEHECARTVAMQMAGGKYTTQIKGIDAILNGTGGRDIGLYAMYESDNPSNELRTIGNYYDAGQG